MAPKNRALCRLFQFLETDAAINSRAAGLASANRSKELKMKTSSLALVALLAFAPSESFPSGSEEKNSTQTARQGRFIALFPMVLAGLIPTIVEATKKKAEPPAVDNKPTLEELRLRTDELELALRTAQEAVRLQEEAASAEKEMEELLSTVVDSV